MNPMLTRLLPSSVAWQRPARPAAPEGVARLEAALRTLQ